jgi:hypothetical protein
MASQLSSAESRLSNTKIKRYVLTIAILPVLLVLLASCTNPENTPETTRNDGDSTPISAEAAWARSIANLRADDAGTNNGRARNEILEVLYTLRARLRTEGVTEDIRGDLFVIRVALQRLYASANPAAQSEWRYVAQDFTILENQLDNPEQAIRALNRIIARLGG